MGRASHEHGIPYFPAFLDLLRKRVVVVGGGHVATTKVRALLPCQPSPLIVVAPHASEFIQEAPGVEWRRRQYESMDIQGAACVFAATDDRTLNARVAADARDKNVPVLAVDDVPNCDFIAPAIVRRGDVVIAISTGGRSPAMARRVREHLDRTLPAWWGELLDVAATTRQELRAAGTTLDPDNWQLLLDDLEASLFAPGDASRALVSLVGAGPGDPELLTLRALRRLRAADAVVHDRLVSDAVLQFAAPHAVRYDVGKAAGGAGTDQRDIETLLVSLARRGQRVVRLKGGDPFVFGRGGEEALALARAGIAYEIVPGVSAALAAPAAAGIPVTHRDLSPSVTIATGQTRQSHDWQALAHSAGTLVFLMAVERLDSIAQRLLEHGRAADEPAAIVQWATTPRQQTVVATLGGIVQAARGADIEPPAVLVVGPTAALSTQLAPEGRCAVPF
ncbi:MAG TPA: siroheme synthase CysG [Chloroflexota bacterium]|jgi:uroporphyrin-III C-methyltransferase/precorrin-2 dehydrogenase/sirohydrochlorin ferrochelatase|nr:siroheme synthase CysG [Chloroflexota bacterium]